MPSEGHLRNPGLGLVVDVLYFRCDCAMSSHVPEGSTRIRSGNFDLDAAKRKGLRVALRIQLSNNSFQPEQVALPAFLRDRVVLVKIGRIPGKDKRFNPMDGQDAAGTWSGST